MTETPHRIRHWLVRLSYRGLPEGNPTQFRTNLLLGVLAMTAEDAIRDARARGIPMGSMDVRVWSVSDQGAMDVFPQPKTVSQAQGGVHG